MCAMDAPLQEPITNSLLAALQEEADSLRAFRRFPLNLPVGVGMISDKPLVRGTASAKSPATLTNASVSGFCFSSLEEFSQDTLILVEVELGRRIHRVPAVVRRCAVRKKQGRTFYECGAQYVKSDATSLFLPLRARYLRLRASGF